MSTKSLRIIVLLMLAGCGGADDTSQYAVCRGCRAWHRIPRPEPGASQLDSLWADETMKAFVEGHLRCNTDAADPMQKAIVFQDGRRGLEPSKEDASAPGTKPGA